MATIFCVNILHDIWEVYIVNYHSNMVGIVRECTLYKKQFGELRNSDKLNNHNAWKLPNTVLASVSCMSENMHSEFRRIKDGGVVELLFAVLANDSSYEACSFTDTLMWIRAYVSSQKRFVIGNRSLDAKTILHMSFKLSYYLSKLRKVGTSPCWKYGALKIEETSMWLIHF